MVFVNSRTKRERVWFIQSHVDRIHSSMEETVVVVYIQPMRVENEYWNHGIMEYCVYSNISPFNFHSWSVRRINLLCISELSIPFLCQYRISRIWSVQWTNCPKKIFLCSFSHKNHHRFFIICFVSLFIFSENRNFFVLSLLFSQRSDNNTAKSGILLSLQYRMWHT